MARIRLKRRKEKGLAKREKEEISEVVRQELAPYMTREQLQAYLNDIRSSEAKLQKWNSLTPRKRRRLLRYVAGRGAGNAKK